MLELPEAKTIAEQCRNTLTGKTISSAVAGQSPHGFAGYSGDPAHYGAMLEGKTIGGAFAHAGQVELLAGDMALCFNDGTNLRCLEAGVPRPAKHQLLLEFTDGSALCVTLQMYGGLLCFPQGTNEGFYYTVAREKPSPLTPAFDEAYFMSLLTEAARKLSAKAFLATEQRIPGLGNGCLQDILWKAKIHPKRKMHTLSGEELSTLYHTAKAVLADMTAKGGRDTEKDLFGKPGGYAVVMGKKNDGGFCPACGTPIRRMAYMGGNVYVCEGCQKL